jgi:uncharacterized membrane protein
MMILGWLGLLLLSGLIVALLAGRDALGLGQSGTDRNELDSHAASARDLLDRRLARGEISPEEYEEIREKIES